MHMTNGIQIIIIIIIIISIYRDSQRQLNSLKNIQEFNLSYFIPQSLFILDTNVYLCYSKYDIGILLLSIYINYSKLFYKCIQKYLLTQLNALIFLNKILNKNKFLPFSYSIHISRTFHIHLRTTQNILDLIRTSMN